MLSEKLIYAYRNREHALYECVVIQVVIYARPIL